MANYWGNTPNKRTPNTGKTISAIPYFEEIPWAEGDEYYSAAADQASELADMAFRATMDSGYKQFLERKALEWHASHPEEGEYEGNFADENPQQPYPPTPDYDYIRRNTGQKAFAERFLSRFNPNALVPKVLPKLIDLVGSWHTTKNETGLISGLEFCKDHFNTPERMGMYRLLTLNAKSSFLEKQYTGDAKNYSALVPLVMYAQKKSKGIPYSAWDRDEIHYITHSKLVEAMTWHGEVPDPKLLLEARESALKFASGVKIGQSRSPISTHRLYSTTGTCYASMPEYVQVMLSQIWCAHPDNRTKYMVLDPLDWDAVPMPLIGIEPMFKPGTKSIPSLGQWG